MKRSVYTELPTYIASDYTQVLTTYTENFLKNYARFLFWRPQRQKVDSNLIADEIFGYFQIPADKDLPNHSDTRRKPALHGN